MVLGLAAGGVPPIVEQKLEKLESDRAILRTEVAHKKLPPPPRTTVGPQA